MRKAKLALRILISSIDKFAIKCENNYNYHYFIDKRIMYFCLSFCSLSFPSSIYPKHALSLPIR